VQDATDTGQAWVLRIRIDWEAVINLLLVHVEWDTAEAESWEHFVVIVYFENASNLADGLLVLVHPLGVHMVERVRVLGVPVRRSVIDCGGQ